MERIVYSYDVFDTVLTRKWARPFHIFYELGYILKLEGLINNDIKMWVNTRRHVERRLRKDAQLEDITLESIYKELANLFSWNEEQRLNTMNLEIKFELESHRCIPDIVSEIHRYRAEGSRIIFISDMYLPKWVIEKSLELLGIISGNEKIYVSCEHGLSKATGNLFREILQRESLQKQLWVHCGDNKKSDVNVPRKLGIESKEYRESRLTKYEQVIADNEMLPLRFRSIFAGSMRLARLACNGGDKHEKTIWDTSVDVIGPVLLGFLLWCFQEVKAQGIKRLYFVSRDGDILFKMAKELRIFEENDIECKYLYGSRQAWHLPSIESLEMQNMKWILDTRMANVTIREILKRVNIDTEEISGTLVCFGLDSREWDKVISRKNIEVLRKVLLSDDVRKLIHKKAADARSIAMSYFKQEGIIDNIPFAILDIGWRGTLQRSMSNILDISGLCPERGIVGYYFGLINNYVRNRNNLLYAYYNNISKDQILCLPLLEIFTEATHGMVMGYRNDGVNKVVPVFKESDNKRANEWGLKTQHKGIMEFVSTFVNEGGKYFNFRNLGEKEIKELRNATHTIFDLFVHMPSLEEANTYGSFIKSSDQTEFYNFELAPRLNYLDLLLLGIFGKSRKHVRWRYGSLKRSNSMIAPFLTGVKSRMTSKLTKFRRIIKGKYRNKF